MAKDALDTLHTYLVAVDGGEAGYNALAMAADLAKKHRAHLHLVHVIEVPRALALDADLSAEVRAGERVLQRAEKIASEYGLNVQGDLVQARQAGHAVVDEAVERGADVIVLGVDYKRPLGQFQLGRLAQYVLEHAPVLVWLVRYPSPEVR
jgi:nucleotide-binding universal stress UspA family protein